MDDTACLDGHLTFLKFGIVLILVRSVSNYLLEFFAHEHILLSYETIDLDTVCVILFFQLPISTFNTRSDLLKLLFLSLFGSSQLFDISLYLLSIVFHSG
jgi:hypothetical protein